MREYVVTYEMDGRSFIEHFMVLSAAVLCHEIDAIKAKGGVNVNVNVWN